MFRKPSESGIINYGLDYAFKPRSDHPDWFEFKADSEDGDVAYVSRPMVRLFNKDPIPFNKSNINAFITTMRF